MLPVLDPKHAGQASHVWLVTMCKESASVTDPIIPTRYDNIPAGAATADQARRPGQRRRRSRLRGHRQQPGGRCDEDVPCSVTNTTFDGADTSSCSSALCDPHIARGICPFEPVGAPGRPLTI